MSEDQDPIEDLSQESEVDTTEETASDETEVAHGPSRPYTSPEDVVRHHLRGMYQTWFLEYASYVILERAVPNIEDGLSRCKGVFSTP